MSLGLEAIQTALRDWAYPLGLGRRSYPPSYPFVLPDGLCDTDLATSLRIYPCLLGQGGVRRLLREADDGQPVFDVPGPDRSFLLRFIE